MERPLKETLREILLCAEAWEPEARLLGNVRADDMREAMYRALAAVEFIERHAQHHADAVEIAGHTTMAERIADEASDVLDEGALATRVFGAPPPFLAK